MGPQELMIVIGGTLCTLIVGVILGSILLVGACWLFNKLAGSSGGVPMPSLGKAVLIATVVALVNLVLSAGVTFATGGWQPAEGAAPGPGATATGSLAQLTVLPIGILVMMALLKTWLPTSLGKALLVTLIHFALALSIGIAVIIVMALVAVGLGAAAPH